MVHSLCGWHYSSSEDCVDEYDLQPMIDGANSSLVSKQHISPSFACATTDSLATNNEATAVVVGHPTWHDDEIKQLAENQGQASAVCAAYKKYGMGFTREIGGEYSLVLFDLNAETLLLFTDKLGRYPLFYIEHSQGMLFGSSPSTVLSHQAKQPVINHQGIYDYVYFRMIPSPHSIYSNLEKLPAAHYLKYQKNSLAVQRYWKPTFIEKPDTSMAEMGEELKETLITAVKNCYDPSLPIGAFLSGGLDSSTVTGVLSEISASQAHAYSIGFDAKGYDEMAFARITAKHFGVKLHEYYVTPDDVVEALPLIAAAYDEPFGNSSALPAYFCAKLAAKDGIQRLLAGDGGDELFAGNERYAKQRVFERYKKIPQGFRSKIIEPLIGKLPNNVPLSAKAKSYLTQANTPLPDRLQSYNFLHRHLSTEIFTNDFLHSVSTEAPGNLERCTYQTPENASTLNKMLYFDWQYTLADNDLRKVSTTCSLAGIEVAYPMLDDSLLGLSCKVPSHWKLKGNDLRHFYKMSLRNWLPKETICKDKQGFGLPFGVWMETHKPLQELAYDNLLSLKKRPYFRTKFIDRAIALHRNQHAAYYGELVWILMVLELWMKAHIDNTYLPSEKNHP